MLCSIAWLSAVVLVQAWMAWNFIMFQVQRYRESMPARPARTNAEKKKKKAEQRNGSSPRAKASPRAKESPRPKQE